MARGIALELRCDTCHSNSLFPAGGRGRGNLLGELYVSPDRTWMTWTGHYRQASDAEHNRLPGPLQQRPGGPGTTWHAVPRDGVQHQCRPGSHRMVLTETELWELVRRLPADATVLYLPSAPEQPMSGSDGGAMEVAVGDQMNDAYRTRYRGFAPTRNQVVDSSRER